MSRLGLGVVLLAGGVAAGASSPDPKDLVVSAGDRARAADLVRQLGNDEYRYREQAERELAAMGRLARPALAAAAGTDPSPEVRVRVARLLPKAEAAERKARIDTFLADADGKFAHDLPGWAAFREHVGADKGARELYAEVVRSPANLDLLAAVEGSKEVGGRAIADRRFALYVQLYPQVVNRFAGASQPRTQPPSVPDVVALALAEVAVPAVPRGPFQSVTAGTFMTTPAAAAALHTPDAPHGAAFRKLVGVWMDTRTAADDLTAAGQVAQTLPQFPQAVPLLRRVVTTPGVHGYARVQAVGHLVQRRGADEGAFLRSLLADDTKVIDVWLGNNGQGGQNQTSCLLKDLALGALILQAGEEVKAYGFDTQPGSVTTLTTLGNGGVTFAFTSDEKRAAGFKKWADAEAARKDKKADEKK